MELTIKRQYRHVHFTALPDSGSCPNGKSRRPQTEFRVSYLRSPALQEAPFLGFCSWNLSSEFKVKQMHTHMFFWKNLNKATSRRLKRPLVLHQTQCLGQGRSRSHSMLLKMMYAAVQDISIAYNVILRRPKSGICGLSGSYGLWSHEFLWV